MIQTTRDDYVDDQGLCVPLVYIITCNQPRYPVKIGRSTSASIRARFSQLQTAMPYKLVPLLIVEGGVEWEAGLHDEYEDRRMRGEWFDFTEAEHGMIGVMIKQLGDDGLHWLS